MLLLGIKHSQQQREADCLVACCAMVLDYLQVPIGYDRLTRLLEAQDFGAFFSRVQNLETLGVYCVQNEKRSFRQSIFPEGVTDWLVDQTIFDPFREDLELRFSI